MVVFAAKISAATEAPTDETKHLLINAYLRRKCELEGRNADELSDTEIEMWMTALGITDLVRKILSHFLKCFNIP